MVIKKHFCEVWAGKQQKPLDSAPIQSNQGKRTPVDAINKSSIRKLNPLVVQRMLSF